MSLSEKIAAKQKELVEARDVLVDLTAKEDDSEEHQDALIEATEVVEKHTAELDKLKAAEAAIEKSIARADKAPAVMSNPAAKVKDSDKGDLLVKSALCAFEAYVKRVPVESVVASRYGDDEVVKAVTGMTTKAAQNPAMTNVPAWAGNLTRESYMGFMDLLRGESVVPRIPMTRLDFGGNASIKIPNRTAKNPNLSAAFRAEGAPIRVGALSIGTTTLTPKSMGVIGTYTMEMLDRSTPSIESIIRDAMIQDTAEALDTAFLSATAGSATVPAGIQTYATSTNTAASGGATTSDIIADVRGRLQAMTGANMGRRPVWIMNPARFYGVQLAVNAAGAPAFPEAAQGQLMGIPVVTSTNVPGDIVFLVDAAEIYFAGGAPRFLGTEISTIHEENDATAVAPIVDGAAAAASPVRSLYQTNSAALRAVWELDWTCIRGAGSGAVQTLTGVAW